MKIKDEKKIDKIFLYCIGFDKIIVDHMIQIFFFLYALFHSFGASSPHLIYLFPFILRSPPSFALIILLLFLFVSFSLPLLLILFLYLSPNRTPSFRLLFSSFVLFFLLLVLLLLLLLLLFPSPHSFYFSSSLS